MKSTILILSVFLLASVAKFDPVKSIDKHITQVNADKSLKVKKFDAAKVYNRFFDRGGEIALYLDGNKLVRISETINLSWGKTTTNMYLKHNDAVAVIESEEDFVIGKDNTMDLAKMKKVFETKIYLDHWATINTQTTGKRVNSEAPADVTDYRELQEKAAELLAPASSN
jgi:hypothetical protein